MSVQTMAAPPKQHIAWLDIAKGIGITLVVLGHLRITGFAHFFVYVFHMPLFFFISGYLHKVDVRFGSYARKKAVNLLLPFATLLVMITVMKAPHFIRHGLTFPRVSHALFVLVWGGRLYYAAYGILWFLQCLYVTQQVMNYLLARLSVRAAGVAVAAGLVLAYINYLIFPDLSLPFAANIALGAAPFYYAGHVLRGVNIMSWKFCAGAIVCLLITAGVVLRGDPLYGSVAYLDFKHNAYGWVVITFALSLGCVLGTLQLSNALPSRTLPGRALSRLGLLSLPIMLIHAEILNRPEAQPLRSHGLFVALVLVLGISWGIAEVMMRFTLTRALFFGSLPDFEAITHPKERVMATR